MGFFSNIKNRARGMPMAPQPMQELRAGQIIPNSPQVGRSSSPSRMPAPPARFDRATAPVLNPGNIGGNLGSDFRAPQIEDMRFRGRAPQKKSGLGGLFRKLQEQIKNQQRPQQMPQQNLDFLSRLPQNMMPQVDFSNLPQMSGNPNIPAPDGYELREDEKGMNYFREQLSPEDQAQNMLPRRLDVPFQDFNLKNMRPRFFGGRDVNIDDGGMVDFLNSNPEQVLFGIENRIGILQNQLEEAKANRDRESFDMIVQEINDADAQRIEIMNSMNPRVDRMEAGRGRNLSNRDREILGETGRTISNMDRSYIDDILSSLEKKKLDNPPEESISVKDVTDIFFDPTDPIDYAALASGPFIKAGLSAKKAKKLYDGLQKIKQQKRQAQTDYRRGQAEYNAGEPQGAKLMSKSQEKFNRLSVNEAKITKQLEGYQPEIL
jgi:hypothetical protein